MKWLKAHWKAPAVVLILLLAWGSWYARPVDLYGLTGLTPSAVNTISFSLRQFDSCVPGGTIDVYGSCTPESPEWDAVREAVETLRFRRPPWNLLLQFFDSNFLTGRQTKDGDYHIMLTPIAQGGGYVNLQFFLDEWTYSSPWSNRNLTLWVEDSRETGNALAEALWSLLEKS